MKIRQTPRGLGARTCVAVAMSALLIPAAALAQGKPPGAGGGGGGGGGGNKPPTEASFSLSVPAIMASGQGAFTALSCPTTGWSELTKPSKPPVFYNEACAETNDGLVCVDAGYYFVQRDAAWQAPCTTQTGSPVTATGAWGDNLAGDAKLKVGSPIRVELVLWDAGGLSTGQQGYKVIKLEPAELDRLSDYGHVADATLNAIPRDDLGAIVHDPKATLKIEQVGGGVVFEGPAGGEINATGKIVYGYNLRVSTAGTYRITYTLPNVSLTGCDEPTATCSGTTASLDIVVGTGGGGGGGKGGGQGGGKPVKP